MCKRKYRTASQILLPYVRQSALVQALELVANTNDSGDLRVRGRRSADPTDPRMQVLRRRLVDPVQIDIRALGEKILHASARLPVVAGARALGRVRVRFSYRSKQGRCDRITEAAFSVLEAYR